MQTRADGKTLDYMTRTFVREPDYIAAIRAEGERRRAGMQVSPYEGALLAWVVAISGATRILEVGTFMGYSTLWMASALPDKGHITSLEFDADHAQQARQHVQHSPHKNQIQIVHTDALAWLKEQPCAPQYDLVFIDADKRNYFNYLNAVLPLLKPRGWVVGDNTLLFGALSGENPEGARAEAKAAMLQFNDALADPDQFEGIMLPTPEGLTVARRKG